MCIVYYLKQIVHMPLIVIGVRFPQGGGGASRSDIFPFDAF